MFPNVPAESLFWDFIDVVGNETAPKSIYLGLLAAIDTVTNQENGIAKQQRHSTKQFLC